VPLDGLDPSTPYPRPLLCPPLSPPTCLSSSGKVPTTLQQPTPPPRTYATTPTPSSSEETPSIPLTPLESKHPPLRPGLYTRGGVTSRSKSRSRSGSRIRGRGLRDEAPNRARGYGQASRRSADGAMTSLSSCTRRLAPHARRGEPNGTTFTSTQCMRTQVGGGSSSGWWDS
jgi:hypothetical protein